jgi:hypothetical protein
MEKTLIADAYFSLAILVLAVHLIFNAWVSLWSCGDAPA